MTITTDRRVAPALRASTGSRSRSATPTRRRGTVERRRYVLDTAAREGAHGSAVVHGSFEAQTDRAHRDEKISWSAMVAGVVATAVVILGLVAVANLRADALDSTPGSTGAPVAVVQGFDAPSTP